MRHLPTLLALALPVAAPAAEPTLAAHLGTDRFRQSHPATALTYTPDGKRLVTADGDRLRFWDAESGRTVKTIPVGEEAILALRFAPDTRRLYAATRSSDAIRLCEIDPAADKVVASKRVFPGWAHCTFSPDGSYLIVFHHGNLQTADSVTRVVETAGGKEVISERSLTDPSPGVAFRGDGRAMAVATWRGSVRIFDLQTGKIAHQYQLAHKVTGLTFSLDGKDLYAVTSPDWAGGFYPGQGTGIIRFGAADGRVRWAFQSSRVEMLAIDADGAVRFCGATGESGREHVTRWLDAGSGKLLPDRTMVALNWPTAVHPNGRMVATAGIAQFDLTTRRRVSDASADPVGPVSDLHFSADGAKVFGWAGGWVEWDVRSGKQAYLTPPAREPWVRARAVSADRNWLARDVPRDGGFDAVELVDLRTGTVRELTSEVAHHRLRFLADRRLAAISYRGLTAFDPETGRRLFEIPSDQEQREQVFASDGGTTAVVMALSKQQDSVRVVRWDLTTGRRVGEWTGHPQYPRPPGMSHALGGLLSQDGRWLLVWSLRLEDDRERQVAVFDARSGRRLSGWTDKQRRGGLDETLHGFASVVFSPDARLVACYSDRGRGVEVRELATGGLCRHVPAAQPVTGCAFAPDGRRVAVATSPGPVDLWDLGGRPESWRADQADGLWEALRSETAELAYDAIAHLQAHPAESGALLRRNVRAPAPPAAGWAVARIKALDAAQFRDREQATADLAGVGELIVPELRAALETASPEARRRLDGLLEKAATPSPATWRAIRACEALEGIATPEARDLLTTWAKGAPAATLTREAAASLERLAKRSR
jgi:WD40 repeat protein